MVDAADEGLDVIEAEIAQEHSHGERTGSMMAENDDVLVGVEFGVGAGRDLIHRNEGGVGEGCGLDLPWFAYV